MDDNLLDLDRAVRIIDLAFDSGLYFKPTTEGLSVRPIEKEYDKKQAESVISALRSNSDAVKAVVNNPEEIKQRLAVSQQTLIESYERLDQQKDLWERLEAVYRRVNPDAVTCVQESGKCLDDALISCRAC